MTRTKNHIPIEKKVVLDLTQVQDAYQLCQIMDNWQMRHLLIYPYAYRVNFTDADVEYAHYILSTLAKKNIRLMTMNGMSMGWFALIIHTDNSSYLREISVEKLIDEIGPFDTEFHNEWVKNHPNVTEFHTVEMLRDDFNKEYSGSVEMSLEQASIIFNYLDGHGYTIGRNVEDNVLYLGDKEDNNIGFIIWDKTNYDSVITSVLSWIYEFTIECYDEHDPAVIEAVAKGIFPDKSVKPISETSLRYLDEYYKDNELIAELTTALKSDESSVKDEDLITYKHFINAQELCDFVNKEEYILSEKDASMILDRAPRTGFSVAHLDDAIYLCSYKIGELPLKPVWEKTTIDWLIDRFLLNYSEAPIKTSEDN